MKTLKQKLITAGIPLIDTDDGVRFVLPQLSDGEQIEYDKISTWHFANTDARVTMLWHHINNLVAQSKNSAGLDENAHGKISMWIALGQLPAWRVERLAALDKWSDQAWMTYYALKERVRAGEDVELPDSLPPCPVTFAQLLFE